MIALGAWEGFMSRRRTAIWVSLSGCLWLAAGITAVLTPDLVREYEAIHRLALAGAMFTGIAGLIGHNSGGAPPNLEAFAEVISRLTERALMQPAPGTPSVQRRPESGIRIPLSRPRFGQALAFSLVALLLGAGVVLATRAESSSLDQLAVQPAIADSIDASRRHLTTSDWMPDERTSASARTGNRSGYPPTRLASRRKHSTRAAQPRTVPAKVQQSGCGCRAHDDDETCVIQVDLPGAQRELAGGVACL